MKKIFSIFLLFAFVACFADTASAQYRPIAENTQYVGKNRFALPVSIGDTGCHQTAILDLVSDSLGLLVPRMSAAKMAAIASPDTGLLIYNTSVKSFHYYNGSSWIEMAAGTNTFDSIYFGSGFGDTINISRLNLATMHLDTGLYAFPGTLLVDTDGTVYVGAGGGSSGCGCGTNNGIHNDTGTIKLGVVS